MKPAVSPNSYPAGAGHHVMSGAELAAALTEFPQLQLLMDLGDAGWIFLPTAENGEVIEIHGVRMWPLGWADAMRVRHVSDACAVRCDHAGAVTWRREGTLTDVTEGLLSLPAPDDRLAPRLVIATGPPLWTP